MAASKTARALLNSQALAAAASVNASEWNLSTAYGGVATVKLTNGSTPPTTPPVVKFYIGEATGVKRLFYQISGDTVANSVNDIVCELPMGVMFANVTIVNGATSGITVEVAGQELTGI